MADAVEEPTTQPVHDPICHKDMAADEAAGSLEYEGFVYYFCSDACQRSFESNPAGAVAAESQHDHG